MNFYTIIYALLNCILIFAFQCEWIQNKEVFDLIGIGLILTIGIAHGAIDNWLYGVSPGSQNQKFIAIYVFIILFAILFWYLLPDLSFVLFLTISAYHFGESQLSSITSNKNKLDTLLYLSWGAIIISMMLYLNTAELLTINKSYFEFLHITTFILEQPKTLIVAIIIFTLLFILLITIYYKQSLKILTQELLRLSIVALSFTFLPFLLSFSIFFVGIHATKVISQEYHFCKKKLQITNFKSFTKLFVPLTTVSIIGIILLWLVAYYINLEHYIPFMSLVLISCITLPHAMVMKRFYFKQLHR